MQRKRQMFLLMETCDIRLQFPSIETFALLRVRFLTQVTDVVGPTEHGITTTMIPPPPHLHGVTVLG